MNTGLERLRDWVGRTEEQCEPITAVPMAALAAALDREDAAPRAGTELPPLWHWLYFTPRALARDIDADGHAKRGGFLPPVPLPRRMWAGSRLEFHRPLCVGNEVTKHSRITAITPKSGRSGTLVFVTVRHEYHSAQELALSEEQDIVYREAPTKPAATPTPAPAPEIPMAPNGAHYARKIVPDPVLLFRYSALTFNSHRIHYDRPYATDVEGYAGLVVHGPLIATLLLDLLRREQPQARVARFTFKAVHPILDTHPFSVCGKSDPADAKRHLLWARDHAGHLAMQASAELA